MTLAINTGVPPGAWIDDPAAAVTASAILREQAKQQRRPRSRRGG